MMFRHLISRHLIVKFYLWILVALTVSVAVASGTMIVLSDSGHERNFSSWMLSEARIGRDILANLLAGGVSPAQLRKAIAPLARHSRFSIAVLRPGNQVVVALPPNGRDTAAILPNAAESAAIQTDGHLVDFHREGRVTLGLPIDLPGGETGIFFITMKKRFWRGGVPSWHFLAGLGAILVVAWALSWPLAAHLSRPLRKLSEAADALGRGDLSTRIDLRRRDEVGRLGERFNAMADNLQKLVMGHKQLLADISHEIRSPLARLKVALELARQEATARTSARTSAGTSVGASPESPAGGSDALDRLERQADAIEAMAAELLDYSRLEIAPYELKRETIQPVQLLEEAAAELRDDALARDLKIELPADSGPQAGLPAIQGERRLLARALGNVLRNALEHAPAGSAVRAGAALEGARLVFHVTDQGPGAPERLLERIFQPFIRADVSRSRATGGVGLGLAIARRCMEAHGGGAEARPGPQGRGLTVRLWLPVRAEQG